MDVRVDLSMQPLALIPILKMLYLTLEMDVNNDYLVTYLQIAAKMEKDMQSLVNEIGLVKLTITNWRA